MLERSALFAVNHLLSHNPEAAALLGAHAGKRLRLRAPPLPDLLARVGEDGRLQALIDAASARMAQNIVDMAAAISAKA